MQTNKRIMLYARLVRHAVPHSIANALAQAGLLTYEQSLTVHGADIKRQAMTVYEQAPNKATVSRVWNEARLEFDYEVRTADRTLRFTTLKEARAFVYLCQEACFRLAAFGRELKTLAREAAK